MRWLDVVDSTMAEAHRLAEQGAAHGAAVAAVRQTAGRGRLGRPWQSPPGGLWLSVVLHPSSEPVLEALTLRVGMAIAEVLEARYPALPPVQLKWPNDLLIGGRKLGGILAEARWKGARCLGVIVGLGLNVVNPIPDDLRGRAVALASVLPRGLGATIGPAELAAPLARAIADAGRGGALGHDEMAAWTRRDWLRDRPITGPVPGRVEGISPDGALLVRAAGGDLHHVRAGVVTPGS